MNSSNFWGVESDLMSQDFSRFSFTDRPITKSKSLTKEIDLQGVFPDSIYAIAVHGGINFSMLENHTWRFTILDKIQSFHAPLQCMKDLFKRPLSICSTIMPPSKTVHECIWEDFTSNEVWVDLKLQNWPLKNLNRPYKMASIKSCLSNCVSPNEKSEPVLWKFLNNIGLV